MIQIREQIRALLLPLSSIVYFQDAPDNAAFPYVTFNIPNSFMAGEVEVWVLDVDVWDSATDSTALETLANNINMALHRARYIGDGFYFTIYREGRQTPDDEDPRIKRRKLTFQVRCLDEDQIKTGG